MYGHNDAGWEYDTVIFPPCINTSYIWMDTLREYWESESLTRPQSKLEGVIKYQFQNFGKGAALFIGPIKLQIVNLSVIRLQWILYQECLSLCDFLCVYIKLLKL